MSSWWLRTVAAVLLLGSAVLAQTPPAEGPAAEVAKLVREHEESTLDHAAKYAQWRPRFEAFAAAHRGTEEEVTALLWLLQQTWWLREKGEMEPASGPLVDDLLARHAGSPQLAKIPSLAYVLAKAKKKPVLEQLLASPHAAVQAAAHLGLARLAPPAPGWRAKDPDDAQRAHPHLVALRAKFASVPYLHTTYGAIAEAMLAPYGPEQLAVGAAAPEIEGVDQDGKPMKLSDFRGKVVLLDFWGRW